MYLSSHFSVSVDVRFFSVRYSGKKLTDNYHFITVQSGSIAVTAGEETFTLAQNDIFLLEPQIEYEFSRYSENLCMDIRISRNFISQLLSPDSQLVCNSSLGRRNDYQELSAVLSEIAALYVQENAEIPMTARLCTLTDILVRNHIVNRPLKAGNLNANRVKEIRSYIQNNFHHALSLQELADQMYLSPQYLSKFIKQNMGDTFIHILNRVRMEHAYEELISTEHSVTEIAFNSGFPNTNAFNKSFRDIYSEAPGTYRLHFRELEKKDNAEAAPVFVPKASPLTEKPDSSENIILPSDQVREFYPSWCDTINIGNLSNALSVSFHNAFMDFQKKTCFRYVRFDNIFSEEIMRPLKDGRGFDYSNLNMAFDLFRNLNILPFIELSFKPDKTNPTNHRSVSFEETFRAERNLDWYKFALDDMLRHCINRYGFDYVSQWRFEVWEKHDDLLNYPLPASEYVKKFRLFKDTVKALLPSCSVGGPGYNTSTRKFHFLEILKEMNRQNVYPDFFSLYIYSHTSSGYEIPATGGSRHLILAPDPDLPLKLFHSYTAAIRENIPGQPPVYVTEFTSGLLGENYISASAFQAAFICKISAGLFSETPCIAYWHFSDEAQQFSTNPRVYSTDTGLVDAHSIPKASMYACRMLSILRRNLIACGSNYIATAGGYNQYQILAFHYAHYCRDFCINYSRKLAIHTTYEAFEKPSPIKMTFFLSHLAPGRYKVLKTTLNRTHGSLLDEFIRIFNEGYLNEEELNSMILNMGTEEVDYYKHSIHPHLETRYMETDKSNCLRLECTLEAHEVVTYQIIRKA